MPPTILERVDRARTLYKRRTGKLPTRLILTANDWTELTLYLYTHKNEPAYIGPPHTNEPELYGMRLSVEALAKELRVYFQES